MSRSYSTFRERQPFSDGWKEANYSAMAPPDHVHRPFMVETEGMQMPIIRYASGSNGESYIIKAEIVEHSIFPAPYRYGWQQGEEKFRDCGVENRHRDLGSGYHYPEKVEEFIDNVVSEASRGRIAPVAPPLTHPWRTVPKRNVQENNGKYGDERDFRRDDRKELNDNLTWHRHTEPYLNDRGANTHPMIGGNRDVHEFYRRPQENEGPNARTHPLSKPTNEINTAVEFLKEPVKPSYGNGKEKEKEFDTSVHNEPSRPIRTIPLGTTRWRTGSNMSCPDTKVEPKDYDSEKEKQESINLPRKFEELKIANNREGEKPFENKDGYDNPKRNAAAVQFGQTAGKKKTPETIDSREASKRYGKLPSRAKEEDEEYDGTITSKDAVRKYNGALVP